MVGRTTRSRAKTNESMYPAPTNTKKKRTVSQRSPVMKRKDEVLDNDNTNKENQQHCNSNMATPTKNKNKYSSPPVTPGPTPYWKVALERGMSPPNTRSTIKKKKRESSLPTCGVSGSGILLSFSPPDQAKNEQREKEELERRERERKSRVNRAKDNGQLMIFSPPNKKNRMNHRVNNTTNTTSSSNKNKNEKEELEEDGNNKPPTKNSISTEDSVQSKDEQNSSKHGNDGTTPQNKNKKGRQDGSNDKRPLKRQSLLDPPTGKTPKVNRRYSTLAITNQNDRMDDDSMDDEPLISRLATIQNTLETIQNENNRVGVIQDLIKKSEELRIKNEDLQKEKANNKVFVSNQLNERQIVIEQKAQENTMLRNKCQKLQDKISQMEENVGNNCTEKEVDELRSFSQTLEQEKETLKQQLSQTKVQAEESIQLKSNENATLLSNYNDQTEKMKLMKEDFETSILKTNDEIKELNTLNDTLMKQNEELWQQIDLNKRESEKVVEEKIQENTVLQEKCQELQDKVNRIDQNVKGDNSRLQQKMDEVNSLNDTLQKEIKELRQQMDCDKKKAEKMLEEKSQENTVLQTRCQEAEEKFHQLELNIASDNSELRKEIDELHVSKQKLENENEELKQQMYQNTKQSEKILDEKSKRNMMLQTKCKDFQERIADLESNVSEHVSTLESLAEEINQKDEQIKTESTRLQESEKRNDSMSMEIQSLNEELVEATNELENVEKELEMERNRCHDTANRLDTEIIARQIDGDKLRKQLSKLEHELQISRRHVQEIDKREMQFNRKIRYLDDVRRVLHDKVIQLTGNIRVFVRIRSVIPKELENNCDDRDTPFSFPSVCDQDTSSFSGDLSKSFIEAKEPYKNRGGLKERRKKWKFAFDHVFSPSHDQRDVWLATEPLVQSSIDGYNVCLFAYGQTGSGKTYTMLGDEKNPGIITRALEKLFSAKTDLETTSMGSTNVTITLELLEIYNEHVHDLLSRKGNSSYNEIHLHINSNEALGNKVVEANSTEDVMSVLEIAQKRRCVKATKSNSESSRSHLIFTVNFICHNNNEVVRSGKLHICDLAGSERLSKSECTGMLLKETQHINKSLSSLSNVIENLQSKNKHVPYRDSKLTYLLRNSLGGDSKTLAIVCCNPLASSFNESLCSLRFASKANKVELKAAGNFSC